MELVQDRFYGELKQKGYNALLDVNDKSYSSYRAKDPIIVFDVNSVAKTGCLTPSQQEMLTLNKKYNIKRMRQSIPQTAISAVTSKLQIPFDVAVAYVERKTEDYLNS